MSLKQDMMGWLRKVQEEKWADKWPEKWSVKQLLKQRENSEAQAQPQEDDELKIAQDVLALTAAQAALDVPGVAGMSGGLVDDVAKFIGKDKVDKGVHIDYDEGFLNVTLYLEVKYGSNIPELALGVQNKVKRSLQDLTGYEVQYVDVHIEGVVEEKHEEIIQGDCPAKFVSD